MKSFFRSLAIIGAVFLLLKGYLTLEEHHQVSMNLQKEHNAMNVAAPSRPQ